MRAGAAVLAINAATRGIRPLRHRLSVTSSHIVLTEPVPDVLEAIGWTGGECITDARTFVHYFRTTRDGRIAFGWGGGRLAPGARLGGRVEVDPEVAAETHAHLVDMFPALEGRAITHAWGGPIDVSPEPPAADRDARRRARSTTRSASPATASARRTWPAASSPRWRAGESTDLAVVDPEPVARPAASRSRSRAECSSAVPFYVRNDLRRTGERVDPLTRAVAAAPRALGIHVAADRAAGGRADPCDDPRRRARELHPDLPLHTGPERLGLASDHGAAGDELDLDASTRRRADPHEHAARVRGRSTMARIDTVARRVGARGGGSSPDRTRQAWRRRAARHSRPV